MNSQKRNFNSIRLKQKKEYIKIHQCFICTQVVAERYIGKERNIAEGFQTNLENKLSNKQKKNFYKTKTKLLEYQNTE